MECSHRLRQIWLPKLLGVGGWGGLEVRLDILCPNQQKPKWKLNFLKVEKKVPQIYKVVFWMQKLPQNSYLWVSHSFGLRNDHPQRSPACWNVLLFVFCFPLRCAGGNGRYLQAAPRAQSTHGCYCAAVPMSCNGGPSRWIGPRLFILKTRRKERE